MVLNEAHKSLPSLRRNGDLELLRGHGIDIGAGDSPLQLGPMASVDAWDKDDGDAQTMAGVPDETYDFVFSSHCLEHLRDIGEALRNWARILKPGGAMIILVPDFVLYEHGKWPSLFNADHRQTFSLFDLPTGFASGQRWVESLECHTLADMIRLGKSAALELLDARLTFDGYDLRRILDLEDQTLGQALAQVTYVFRKTS